MKLESLDNLIRDKYQASYLSNAKWEKLLNCVTSLVDEVHFNYKLVYEDQVRSSSLMSPDCHPFFIEPILYKEVEWIEFPKEYESYVSKSNLKAGNRTYSQNVEGFKSAILTMGKFELESSNKGFIIYAYK